MSAVVNGHGGFEIGGRYRFVGFSFGSADNSFGWDTPTPLDYSVPHSDYKTIEFDGGDYIAQVFGFLDLTNYFAVYASGGYNWKGYQSIDRSNVTGLYYKSAQSGRFGDGGVAYGTGAQFTLFRFLAIGGGYNVPAGIEAHVGYRF